MRLTVEERANLRQDVAAIELAWECGIEGAVLAAEPELLRRQASNAIVDALLGAGTSTPASAATVAKTLVALGLTVAT